MLTVPRLCMQMTLCTLAEPSRFDRDDADHHSTYSLISVADSASSRAQLSLFATPEMPSLVQRLETEVPHPQVRERSGTPGPKIDHHAPGSLIITLRLLEADTLSLDSVDSLRAQLRQVTRCLDEVQKDFTKSKEELREGASVGSPFVQEIQGKLIGLQQGCVLIFREVVNKTLLDCNKVTPIL
ncbi:hypothetical protein BHM03_00011758 [Ensete ventricosum]|uniref:Uncharacterized protein n=1 Tax=Ensete ventricosum TaxID=4639 RepID=A0A445MDF1_ENSVE|nr:hypothetical protein BHM03_00011758 [Ensete ventricosum]